MRQESLVSLLVRWEQALDQGRELTPDELCAARPELLDAVRDGIAAARRLRELASGEPPTIGFGVGEPDANATVPPRPVEMDTNATVPPLPGQFSLAPALGAASPPGYEILGELGRGGMGVVYKARQSALNRVVALKMILSGGHAGAVERSRFLSEAEAIAKIAHPGIVQVYDFGTHEGTPFFSLEFCDGGSLADRLSGTPLPPRDAAAVVERIARAVHAAHAAGIVHRDLKPGNVLLGSDGAPRVTDFGLAKRVEGGGQTQTGAVMGTPSYMAPEQTQGAKDVGPLADVYAVGAILYECLSGRPPFRAATAFDTILQVVADEPVSLRQLNAKVPADLETICHRCLQKDPAKRYATAEALAEDLRRYLEGRPIAARPVGRGERFVRWCRRDPVVAGLLAAVIGVLVMGATLSSVLAVNAVWHAERADNKATEAENNATKAREKERQAEQEKGRADENARTAKQNESDALEQKRQAVEQRDRAERLVYSGKLSLAQSAWQDNNPRVALILLNECQWNLRGWEHRFLWTLFNSHQVTLKGHTNWVTSVAYSPDGKRVVSGSRDNTVKLWDVEKGQETLTLKGHTGGVTCVAFSSDGKRLVSGSEDKTLKVWDAERGKEIHSLNGHTNSVTSVAFSPDNKRLSSGSEDSTLKVWDVEKGQELLWLKGHSGWVRSVTFSPDGKCLVSGSNDSTLKVWDAKRGQELLSLKGHTGSVTSVAFSPDGTRLASGSDDKTVKVWDTENGQELLSLSGYTSHVHREGFHVHSVAFSPNGKRLVSGGGDKTLIIWDAESKQEIITLKVYGPPISSVAFSPNGKRIVSEDQTGKRLAWDVITGQPVPVGDFAPPKGQREARHAGHNLLVTIDGTNLLVQPLTAPPKSDKPDPILKPDLHDWHSRRAAESKQPFAAAFHLERLYRIQPTPFIRDRLLVALKLTPDSPAGRRVRDRLLEYEAARLTAFVSGRHVLTPPPLAGPVPPLSPVVAPEVPPERMSRID